MVSSPGAATEKRKVEPDAVSSEEKRSKAEETTEAAPAPAAE